MAYTDLFVETHELYSRNSNKTELCELTKALGLLQRIQTCFEIQLIKKTPLLLIVASQVKKFHKKSNLLYVLKKSKSESNTIPISCIRKSEY
jgi:hypothetical protein